MLKNKFYIVLSCLILSATNLAAQTLSLDNVLSTIKTNNPQLKMYDADIQSMDAAAKGARSWMAPQVETGFFMTPVITVEPRWYYNLEKRQSKSKNISGNSGNFVSLQTSYHPNWFVISNYDNLKTFNLITVIPTWGIKRNVGKHFTYETAIGIGYGHQFREGFGDLEGVTANLHLRIGYRF